MNKYKNFNINLTLEQRIIHKLLIHSAFLNDIGLLNGKMGIVLTFAHLYKRYENPIYDDMAENVLESLINKINKYTPVGFGSGLTGIGWGIEYLLYNNFLKGNSLAICKKIDKIIMEKDPRRIDDISLENGLEGLLHYVLAHLSAVKPKINKQPFDKVYLNDLFTNLNLIKSKNISKKFLYLIELYNNYILTGKISYKFDIKEFIKPVKLNTTMEISQVGLGIFNGIAGNLLGKTL